MAGLIVAGIVLFVGVTTYGFVLVEFAKQGGRDASRYRGYDNKYSSIHAWAYDLGFNHADTASDRVAANRDRNQAKRELKK